MSGRDSLRRGADRRRPKASKGNMSIASAHLDPMFRAPEAVQEMVLTRPAVNSTSDVAP